MKLLCREMTHDRCIARWSRPSNVVLAVFLVSMLLLQAGCESGVIAPQVEVVIPKGFSGPFVIVRDAGGVDTVTQGWHVQLEVPQSGLVKVQSTEFLHRMSRWDVTESDGQAIPISGEGPNELRMFHHGGYVESTNTSPRHEYFIGSKAEFDTFDFGTFRPETVSQLQ